MSSFFCYIVEPKNMNMNYMKALLGVGLALGSVSSMGQADIELSAEGWDGQSFSVYTFQDGGYVNLHESLVENGKFTYTAEATEQPQFLLLTTQIGRNRTRLPLLANNDHIEVGFDTVSGGSFVWNIESGEYSDIIAEYIEIGQETEETTSALLEPYYEARDNEDEELMQEISAQFQEAYDQQEEAFIELAYENPIYGTVLALIEFPNPELEVLETIQENLPESYRTNALAVNMSNKIELMRKTAIGQPMIDMEVPDRDGNMVALSSMLDGKYTLIDFWASWCGPCRQENPNLVAEYNAYKDRGFNIIGVSLDQNKDPWLKAIDDDQLSWAHVSDLKGWDSAPAGAYGVRSIPANFVVDENGIIVAKNLRGEELGEWLEEQF